jgi:hypothetical protein
VRGGPGLPCPAPRGSTPSRCLPQAEGGNPEDDGRRACRSAATAPDHCRHSCRTAVLKAHALIDRSLHCPRALKRHCWRCLSEGGDRIADLAPRAITAMPVGEARAQAHPCGSDTQGEHRSDSGAPWHIASMPITPRQACQIGVQGDRLSRVGCICPTGLLVA